MEKTKKINYLIRDINPDSWKKLKEMQGKDFYNISILFRSLINLIAEKNIEIIVKNSKSYKFNIRIEKDE